MGFDPLLIAPGNGRADGGQEAITQLLRHPAPPMAVFCYNDMTAIGAMQAIQQTGLRVPDDISVIGYDNVSFAAYVTPPLTTIRQHMYEMGYQATEMALSLLNGGGAVENILVPGELVERESCAPPRGAQPGAEAKVL